MEDTELPFICSYCSGVTDAGLFTVTKHCSKLKEVDIEESQFTPEILNMKFCKIVIIDEKIVKMIKV